MYVCDDRVGIAFGIGRRHDFGNEHDPACSCLDSFFTHVTEQLGRSPTSKPVVVSYDTALRTK